MSSRDMPKAPIAQPQSTTGKPMSRRPNYIDPPQYYTINDFTGRYEYIWPQHRSGRGRPPKYHEDAKGTKIIYFPDGTPIPKEKYKQRKDCEGTQESRMDLRFPTLVTGSSAASSLEVIDSRKRKRDDKLVRAPSVIMINEDNGPRRYSNHVSASDRWSASPASCMRYGEDSGSWQSSIPPPQCNKNVIRRGDGLPPITWDDLYPSRRHLTRSDAGTHTSMVDFDKFFNMEDNLPDNIHRPTSAALFPEADPILQYRPNVTMLKDGRQPSVEQTEEVFGLFVIT